MPSFQTRLKITGLKPGNPPEAVMDTAVESLRFRHHVESHQLELAGGVPQLNCGSSWSPPNTTVRTALPGSRQP